jgi:hypothetical protein
VDELPFLIKEASAEHAANRVSLIEEAGTVAMAHFDTLAPGYASVYVTLTARTAYGTAMLGQWGFKRSADGAVTLIGALPDTETARV